jgi:hypothetical protein
VINSHRANQSDSFHRWGSFVDFPSGKRTVLDRVGMIATFVLSVVNTWVLLVEILR